MKKKVIYHFAPITRVDEENRIVEGICFANEKIPGEKGGYRILRSAMQDATPDYLKWGAVREMHQPKAAGTALGVEWQEDGSAMLRAEIVDDAAWEKVTKGVYKGFSIGVAPLELRGKDVVNLDWIENSLVDRPRDPDAKILMFRADGVEDVEEMEEEVPAEEVRGAFAKNFANRDKRNRWSLALEVLWSCLYDIQNLPDSPESKSQMASEAIDEFRSEIMDQISRGDIPAITRMISAEELETITATLQPDNGQIASLTRSLEEANGQLAEERAARAAAEERAAKSQATRPILNTAAVERHFPTLEQPSGDGMTPAKAAARMEEILRSPGKTEEERMASSREIAELKRHL